LKGDTSFFYVWITYLEFKGAQVLVVNKGSNFFLYCER